MFLFSKLSCTATYWVQPRSTYFPRPGLVDGHAVQFILQLRVRVCTLTSHTGLILITLMYFKCALCSYTVQKNRNIRSGLGIGRHSILNDSDQGQKNLILDKQKYWTTFLPDDGARWKVRWSTKLFEFILRGTWLCEPNFIAIHPIVVEIFKSGQKLVDWRTGWSSIALPQCVFPLTGLH